LAELDNQAQIEDRFITKKYNKEHLKGKRVSQEEVSTCMEIWHRLLKFD